MVGTIRHFVPAPQSQILFPGPQFPHLTNEMVDYIVSSDLTLLCHDSRICLQSPFLQEVSPSLLWLPSALLVICASLIKGMGYSCPSVSPCPAIVD